jgi:hypothetical protein
MMNRYPGPCTGCGHTVPAGQGLLTKGPRGYSVHHVGLSGCDAARAAAAAAPAAPVNTNPVTSPGMYVLDGVFYKVQLSGVKRLYAKEVVVTHDRSGQAKVTFVYALGVVNRLTAADKLTQAQAKEFGMNFGTCINCGAVLEDKTGRSQLAGYGQTCARNNGWYYPTPAEGRAAMARQAVLV